MVKEKVELKPCPFCGVIDVDGTLEIKQQEEIDDFDYYHVVCNCCGARGPAEDDEKSAADQWNVRRAS